MSILRKHLAIVTSAIIALALAALSLGPAGPRSALAQNQSQNAPILVFAAASLKNALDDVNAAFAKAGHPKVTASYASSAVLIKQIENGAPADVFIAADLKWMDYGVEKKVIKANTRFNLLGNTLVLIAAKDSQVGKVEIGPGFDLAKLVGDGRVATGDVKSVPAGIYAKAALETLGAWTAVEPKLAMAENVRAALTLVARGEAAFGIVYETDAKVEPNVTIVGTFPKSSHKPIIYPVAATTAAKAGAKPYLDFLRTGTAQVVFERYGFTDLVPAGP